MIFASFLESTHVQPTAHYIPTTGVIDIAFRSDHGTLCLGLDLSQASALKQDLDTAIVTMAEAELVEDDIRIAVGE